MAAVEVLADPRVARHESPAPSIDARPALPISTSADSLWDRAAERRDWVAAYIGRFFKSRGIDAWVRVSKPGEYPLFVAVDSWMPVGQTDITATLDKSFLCVTISVAPYLESPLLYKVELHRHGRKFSAEHWSLSADELQELVCYLLDGGKRPRFFVNRVPLALRVIGAFVPFVGRPPRNKLIPEARPNLMSSAPALLFYAGILLVAMAAQWFLTDPGDEFGEGGGSAMLSAWAAMAALAMFSVAAWMVRRRPVVEAIPKQSVRTPRREYQVDSWHVSVPGAGEQFERFKQRIYDVARSSDRSIDASIEIHQTFAHRCVEERERLVLSKGQTTLHVHVYQFEKDAFVGWASHLNWSRWAEGEVISKRIKDKRRVDFKALAVGVHVPTEFDLIEADVLAETTHRRIVDEIKAFLKEREIEADLDFKIIRGDRSKALEEGKSAGKSAGK